MVNEQAVRLALDVARLTRERDQARAEVDRLRFELRQIQRTNQQQETGVGWTLNPYVTR